MRNWNRARVFFLKLGLCAGWVLAGRRWFGLKIFSWEDVVAMYVRFGQDSVENGNDTLLVRYSATFVFPPCAIVLFLVRMRQLDG